MNPPSSWERLRAGAQGVFPTPTAAERKSNRFWVKLRREKSAWWERSLRPETVLVGDAQGQPLHPGTRCSGCGRGRGLQQTTQPGAPRGGLGVHTGTSRQGKAMKNPQNMSRFCSAHPVPRLETPAGLGDSAESRGSTGTSSGALQRPPNPGLCPSPSRMGQLGP